MGPRILTIVDGVVATPAGWISVATSAGATAGRR
jgi:hypothetical protein